MCVWVCVCVCFAVHACVCIQIQRFVQVLLCVCVTVFTLVLHTCVSWWNLQLQVVTTHKGSSYCSLQAQGKTHCRRHDRCLPHTTQRLTALWARHMRAWFTANELARGETHHLQHGLVCDVPIKEDHCYKWSNLPFEKLSVWKLNFELNCLLLVLGFLFLNNFSWTVLRQSCKCPAERLTRQ